jgi:DNA-binding MarR family transcriptional regulator
MTTIGYIQFQREWLDRPWAKRDSEAIHVFLYLLCNAAFEPRPEIFAGKPITLQPGQLITGREKIAERTAVNASKVQRILKKLEEFGEIEQQTSNVSRLISINCTNSRTTSEQRANNERTTNEQQMNNERTLYKELKNIRSKEGEEVGATPAPQSAIPNPQSAIVYPGSPAFDLLKRIGKPAAQIWSSTQGEQVFGEKFDLALEWMEVRCKMGKPFVTHQEFTTLAKLYAKHNAEEIRNMIDYSAGKYPDLYENRKNPQSAIRTRNTAPKSSKKTDSPTSASRHSPTA